MMGLTSSRLD